MKAGAREGEMMGIDLTGIVYFFAERFKHLGRIREKVKALFGPCYRLICRMLWKYKGYLYLYHVELPVTLKCSLRCKKCVFMMPYFEHPIDYDLDKLLLYMDRLFDCVDAIQIFRILGGEPFLYPNLDRIIDKALATDKVKTIDIVTNGTILPPTRLFEHMKDSRLTVQISDYGKYSRHKEELKQACDAAGVRCVVRDEKEKNWFDTGGLETRNRTEKELKKQMRRCGEICRNFLDGRLYFCPRASFGAKLGIPDPEGDYVDFTKNKSKEQLRREIFTLNQRRMLSACNYCNQGTKDYVPIPVAEQIER